MKKLNTKSQGFILPTILIMAIFFTTLSIIVSKLAVNNLNLAVKDELRVVAQMAADAGADLGITSLNQDNDWIGTAGEIELFNEDNVRATYEVSAVTDPSDDSIVTLTTTGRTYKPADAIDPDDSRTYQLILNGIDNGGLFSIVTGVGGLYMQNSSKIVGGDVFVNGEIEMINTSQIGLTTNPVRVEVAHQSCPQPANATYPQVCGPSAGDSITFGNSARIYGDVFATNLSSRPEMTDGGYAGPSSGPRPLPDTHDRPTHEAAVATTRTGANASCTTNNGTKTWAANTKINGNVTISRNCVVTMNGDVWITGNLEMTQSGTIDVNDALGATMPNLMIDGATGFRMRNSSLISSNSSGTGIQVLTYHSAAACSPNCADVTGTDLFDSEDIITIDMDNTSSAPDSVLYARWSRVTITNATAIGALVGQTIQLKNSTTITFGTAVPTPGAEKYTFTASRYVRVL